QRTFLKALRTYRALQPDVDDILTVFERKFPSGLDRTPIERFPGWAKPEGTGSTSEDLAAIRRRSFSEFLKMIGDYYALPRPPGSAAHAARWSLDRYEAAWVFDPSNTQAALATVALMRQRPFPFGFDRNYPLMLQLLFPRKPGEYGFSVERDDDR